VQELRQACHAGLAAISAVEADPENAAAARREQLLRHRGLGPHAIGDAEHRQVASVGPLRIGDQHIASGLLHELRPDVLQHDVDVEWRMRRGAAPAADAHGQACQQRTPAISVATPTRMRRDLATAGAERRTQQFQIARQPDTVGFPDQPEPERGHHFPGPGSGRRRSSGGRRRSSSALHSTSRAVASRPPPPPEPLLAAVVVSVTELALLPPAPLQLSA
jgi:hypothetical protein